MDRKRLGKKGTREGPTQAQTFPGLTSLLHSLPLPPVLRAAEVRLHSEQSDQAEMGQLREQLISAFQEQMDVRRRLLELENHAMEVQIDTSRHLLTIAG